jgi:hypothetical protein
MRAPFPALPLLVLLLAGAVSCGGPLGPFSGGRLSGDEGPAVVADWSFVDGIETAQLETQPSDPHSVNVWCAGLGDRLYVPSSMILGPKVPTERSWVSHVQAAPAVRIRLDDTVYPRTAVRVEDPAEFEAARAALEAKYEIAPEDRDPERQIWIYRLEPRS